MVSKRARLQEEYEEALFRVLLHDAAEEEGKALLGELQAMEDSPELQPSEVALKRFTKQLDSELNSQRRVARRTVVVAAVRTMAISLAAVLIVFSIAMTTVSAFRTRVMNIWMDIRPEFTAFQLRGGPGNNAESGSMVVNWSNAFVPTYIPKGFTASSFSFNEGLKRIVFENTNEQTFIIYTELDEASNLVIDTENASRFEQININGQSGTLVVKNNMVTIVWEQGGRLFMIKTQTDVDTAFRMAKGVKFIE